MRFYLKKIRTFIKIVTTNGFETSFNLGLIYFIWPLFVGFIPAYIRVYKKLKNLKLRFSINKEMVKWESKIEEILKSARVGYQMSVEDLVLDQDQLEIIKRDLSTSDEVVIGEIDQDGFFLSDIGPIHGLPSISESEFLKRKRFRVQIVVLRGIVGVRKSFRGDKISFLNEIVALYRLNLCSCNVPAILNVNFQFLTVTSSFIAGTGLRKKLSEAGAKLLDRDVINDANFMRLSEKEGDLKRLERGKNVLNDVVDQGFVDKVFYEIQKIHKAGFILFDIKYGNIIIESKTGNPYFVDFEASQNHSKLPNSIFWYLRDQDINGYLHNDQTIIIYDPELGWSPRPSVNSNNAEGFRSTADLPAGKAAPGLLRIALFGDSYTEGPVGGGWWRILEEKLNAVGIKCEVLNFGVGGYGMDQAYLRWRRDGVRWQPDIVIFGFFLPDCFRNLNLLRPLLQFDSRIPFMKPRFIIEQNRLRLVNFPTPPPKNIADLVRDFDAWRISKWERYYSPNDYTLTLWRRSRLFALIEAKLDFWRYANESEHIFQLSGEPAQIALRILRQMRREVESEGADFYVVNLPYITYLKKLRETGEIQHSSLMSQLSSEQKLIDVGHEMVNEAKDLDLNSFFQHGHYCQQFHHLVGEELAEFFKKEVTASIH